MISAADVSFDSDSISTIISFFSHIFGASLDFLIAAWGALPLPVIVGLAYRIGACSLFCWSAISS